MRLLRNRILNLADRILVIVSDLDGGAVAAVDDLSRPGFAGLRILIAFIRSRIALRRSCVALR